MQPVLVAVSLAWFALVMVATYRIHVLTKMRQFFPPGRVGRFRSLLLAGIIWGFAFNVAWVPVLVAGSA
jgi:dolichyl-phosphate-mannose--protein O-mannosyl transferase